MATKRTTVTNKKITTLKMADEFHVRPVACDCPTAFFHSKFPSQIHQQGTAPNNFTYKFDDVVYNKSNSGIFALASDGALIIKAEGTYFVDFDIRMIGVSGTASGGFVRGELFVETITGYTPYSFQQVPMMFEPLIGDHDRHQECWFHCNSIIHVGDVNYGVPSPQARVYVNISIDGTFDFSPEMQISITN